MSSPDPLAEHLTMSWTFQTALPRYAYYDGVPFPPPQRRGSLFGAKPSHAPPRRPEPRRQASIPLRSSRSSSRSSRTQRVQIGLCQLPIELIQHILELACDVPMVHNLSWDNSASYDHQLRTLRLVARPWNNLVLSTPSLWCVINLGTSVRSIQQRLSLSRGLPLAVITPDVPRHLAPTVQLILPEMRRVKTLRLRVRDPATTPLLTACAPRLRCLELGRYWNGDVISGETKPRLRHLRVERGWMPSDAAVLRSLHSVEIRSSSETVQDLLSKLSECTQLRKLRIDHLLTTAPSTPALAIILPHLTDLALHHVASGNLNIFLNSIQTPSCTSLRIRADDGSVSWILRPLHRHMSMPSGMPRGFPPGISVSSNQIHCYAGAKRVILEVTDAPFSRESLAEAASFFARELRIQEADRIHLSLGSVNPGHLQYLLSSIEEQRCYIQDMVLRPSFFPLPILIDYMARGCPALRSLVIQGDNLDHRWLSYLANSRPSLNITLE